MKNEKYERVYRSYEFVIRNEESKIILNFIIVYNFILANILKKKRRKFNILATRHRKLIFLLLERGIKIARLFLEKV